MLAVLFGITSAFVYGSADFLGGLAARRMPVLRAAGIAAVAGLVALLIVEPFAGGEWSTSAVLWGAASGVAGAIGVSLLYACLAIGPMSILSPLTAVVSAVVPVGFGLIGGERLAPIGYVALGVAFVAVVLVGFVPDANAVRPSLTGVLMAVGSGAAIGSFLILLDQTPTDSGLVPLLLNRAVNAAIMFAAVAVLALVRRRKIEKTGAAGWRSGLLFAIACGVVDATANVGLLVGLRLGELTIQSVLTALYPAGTIILAAIILREHITPLQIIGLVLAIVAGGMFALA